MNPVLQRCTVASDTPTTSANAACFPPYFSSTRHWICAARLGRGALISPILPGYQPLLEVGTELTCISRISRHPPLEQGSANLAIVRNREIALGEISLNSSRCDDAITHKNWSARIAQVRSCNHASQAFLPRACPRNAEGPRRQNVPRHIQLGAVPDQNSHHTTLGTWDEVEGASATHAEQPTHLSRHAALLSVQPIRCRHRSWGSGARRRRWPSISKTILVCSM